MKKLLTILFVFIIAFAKGQVYQTMTQFGYQYKRLKIDSTLHIPSFCGTPTLRNSVEKEGAIAIDTCGNTLYKYTRANGWSAVSGGGTSIDTTSLSNRINSKADTSSLNLKLNISDTSNKWVTSVTKTGDSTIQIVKDGTTTDINFTTSTNATRLITQVWNSTGSTITKGSVVYINGAHSSILPSIALAKANAEPTSAYTYGLVVNDIADNSEGTVIQNGAITNLNLPTSSYTDGQTLYLSPTVAGGYTITKPLAPNHYVAIGTITRAHPVFGTIQVAIRNGFQLDEMSDVSIPSIPNDSTLLQFSRVDSLWHSVSVINAIGTKYIKPSDTATMLTNYAKTSTVALKVNISDTATMLSNYAKTSVVNTKANLSQGTYSFLANNTNASANMASTPFKDVSGSYTGTPTWTGGTAPTGLTNATYQYTQIGKQVTLRIHLQYTSAGTSNTRIQIPFIADFPTPVVPTGLASTTDILYFGLGAFGGSKTNYTSSIGTQIVFLRGTSTGNEIVIDRAAASAQYIYVTIQYFTNTTY